LPTKLAVYMRNVNSFLIDANGCSLISKLKFFFDTFKLYELII